MATSASQTREAIRAVRRTNQEEKNYTGVATVHFDADGNANVEFRGGVSLEAERLIRDHGFKISPRSGRDNGVWLY